MIYVSLFSPRLLAPSCVGGCVVKSPFVFLVNKRTKVKGTMLTLVPLSSRCAMSVGRHVRLGTARRIVGSADGIADGERKRLVHAMQAVVCGYV